MGDAFIVRRGGMANAFAVIAVTYPAGSTCTCSKGTKTLRAKDTRGSFLFMIPEAGTWTVSCTNGTKTKSKNVVIQSQYEAQLVQLTYSLILFKENEGVASGYNCLSKTYLNGGDAGFSLTSERIRTLSNIAGYSNPYFTPAFDITGFNTLYVDVKCNTQLSSLYSLNVVVGTNIPVNYSDIGNVTAQIANHYNTSRTTISLDVSDLTGQMYVKFHSEGCDAYIYNVWLE